MHTRRTTDATWAAIRRREESRHLDGAHRIPSRFATTPQFPSIFVTGGNDLFAVDGITYKGIKVPASGVAAVPTAVPVEGNTYADGLGYGRLVITNELVWVSTRVDVNATDTYDYISIIYQAWITSRVWVQLPITGGGGATARVYLPWLT